MSFEMQNHTHTHTQREITVIIDTSEEGYNAAISDEICKITPTDQSCSQVDLARRLSILLHVVIEQAPFLLTAQRLDSWHD
jgi:hypothetical protein